MANAVPGRDVQQALKAAGMVIMHAAQFLSQWSTRIPESGRVIDYAPDTVRVAFGGEKAPHAITFEAPNAPYWKHPVFATGPRQSWNWAAQIPPRRFLLPAVEIYGDEAVHKLAEVIDKWALEFGFDATH